MNMPARSVGRRYDAEQRLVYLSKELCGMSSRRKRTVMTDDHKAALAIGRTVGAAVRKYLESLESSRPSRGRRVSPESMAKQLADIDDKLAGANALKRLHLIQERKTLEARLERTEDNAGPESFELEFVRVARDYSERKGISYSTWREAGVSPDVLKKAGIDRRTS
jgi:hypothetical protein